MIRPQVAAKLLRIPRELCTVTAGDTIVPWLAAEGPNAYTPDDPPSDEKRFDYGFVMPGVFSRPGSYRFGAESDAVSVYSYELFWEMVSQSLVNRCLLSEGQRTESRFTAPYAVYEYNRLGDPGLAIIQGGSYQLLPEDMFPEVRRGYIRLFHGIHDGVRYPHPTLRGHDADNMPFDPQRMIDMYHDCAMMTFVDSSIAFGFAHAGVGMIQTKHIHSHLEDKFLPRMETCLVGGSPKGNREGTILRGARYLFEEINETCYSLSRRLTKEKFGPNYVELETPLSNVRLSSDFSGEYEAWLIDPDDVTFIASHGCEVFRWNLFEEIAQSV